MRPLPPASIHHITDPHAVYLVQRLFVQIRSLKKEMDALYRAVQGGLDSCGTGATLPERGVCQGVQQKNSTDTTQNRHQKAGLHGNPTLVQRLRDWRKVHLASLHLLMEEAADEMERLRRISQHGNPDVARLLDHIDSSQRRLIFEQEAEIARLRLTDAERAAITRAIETLEGVTYMEAFSVENDATAAATLRGLLERIAPTTAEQTKIK